MQVACIGDAARIDGALQSMAESASVAGPDSLGSRMDQSLDLTVRIVDEREQLQGDGQDPATADPLSEPHLDASFETVSKR